MTEQTNTIPAIGRKARVITSKNNGDDCIHYFHLGSEVEFLLIEGRNEYTTYLFEGERKNSLFSSLDTYNVILCQSLERSDFEWIDN